MKIDLHNGNCFEVMDTIDIDSIDMILTDPPYDLITEGGGMLSDPGRKFISDIKGAGITDSFEVVKFLNQCLGLFNHNQKFCGVFFMSNKQLIEYISWAEQNDMQYGVGIWHKTNPPPLCNMKYLNDVEYWIYIKGNKSKILGDYHSKSMVHRSPINKIDKDKYDHPTIKPVELMKKFITNHTKENDTILDPFMGSGSTGVAAKSLGRNFIGIELDNEYFNTANDRINASDLMDMFE